MMMNDPDSALAPGSALAVVDDMIVQLRDQPGHELAIAIATRGKILADLGRLDEAAESFHQSIVVTMALAQQDAGAYDVMLARFVIDYRECCTEVGLEPDMALLTAAEPFLPVG